jgi:amino acid transporter
VGRRLHSLLTEGWHFILLVAVVGLAVAAIAGLIGLAAGKQGGHEVVTVVIAVGVTGIVCIFLATVLDPMGFSANNVLSRGGGYPVAAAQAELIHEEETGLPAARKKQFRRDDVLYGGGVLLVGLAVLIGYLSTWAGTPPANPFG